jgi:hypothetical protein
MERRRYLSAAAGVLAGLAGCGSGPASTSTRSPTIPTTAPAPDASLSVAIDTARYLVRSFAQDQHQRTIEPDEIVPLGDVSDPLRSALEAALEGGYSTEEVGTELLAQIDAFRSRGEGDQFDPYFSVNGTAYAFDTRVPYFEAGLVDAEDPDPDRTIDQDGLQELAEPARDFVYTIGAFGTNVARVEYRISVVPPSVEDVLERYDYVRDARGVGRISTEQVDPGPPYTIDASELAIEEIWGRPVLAADSLPHDLREFVEAVVTSDRRTLVYPASRTEYRTDDLPAGYDEHLGPSQGPGSGPYVELEGTMYAFRATEVHREHIPLEVSVASAGPDAFELAVAPSQAGSKPAVDGPVEVEATWSVPGPLWVHAGEDRHRLDRVETIITDPAGDDATPVGDEETVSLRPVEELVATYRVPSAVPPGTYRAWGLVNVSWVPADSDRPAPTRPFPFQVVRSVPET